MNWTTFDKALVAGVGTLLLILNNILPIVPPADVVYVNLAVGVLTPIAVFLKANKPPVPPAITSGTPK